MQSRMDSFMEAVTNTSIGFVISMITWLIISEVYGFHTSVWEDLGITGIFTVISILRSYLIRRMFNGKSVWKVIEDAYTKRTTQR
jgi:hypothetical protein